MAQIGEFLGLAPPGFAPMNSFSFLSNQSGASSFSPFTIPLLASHLVFTFTWKWGTDAFLKVITHLHISC